MVSWRLFGIRLTSVVSPPYSPEKHLILSLGEDLENIWDTFQTILFSEQSPSNFATESLTLTRHVGVTFSQGFGCIYGNIHHF